MTQKRLKQIFTKGAIPPAFVAESIGKHSSQTDIGAHSIFLGQVRSDVVAGNTVSAIEYTAYEDMALAITHEIREDIFARFELTCMHVYHSIGMVNVGEICLFVFTSSKHRRQAIDACNEIVEKVKKELPIWGKEIFTDETHQWKKSN